MKILQRILIVRNRPLEQYILYLILLIAVFFRFYNYPFRYGLGDETVRDAVIGIEGARQLQFPLTGAFSSAGAFTFGPWFYYQLIIFHLLVPSVYSSWIYLSIASLLCVLVLYKIGVFLEDRIFGLILAFLGALSPALIIGGKHLTTQNLTNIFALLATWVFLRLAFKNLSYWWGFLFGIILGIGINLHYQMVGLLILPLILLVYRFKRYIYFLTSIIGIAVTFLPLLFFDLNNHWFTLRNMLYYFQYGKNAIYVPNRWLFYLRDFWPSYWADVLGVSQGFALAIIASLLLVIAWSYKKKKLPTYMILLLIAFLFNFVLLRYYWGPRFFGYVNFLRPFVFIFTGHVLLFIYRQKYGNYLLGVIVIVLAAIILPKSIKLLQADVFSTEMYKRVSVLESKLPDKTFRLYTCSKSKIDNTPTLYSLIFLLELKNKYDKKGTPIGLKSDECVLKQKKLSQKNSDKVIHIDEKLSTLYFSEEKEIAMAGWHEVKFRTIYNTVARWWFREQP